MKYEKIEESGKINIHTFLGDQAGCGHIRIIFPSLMINQYRYKKLRFESSYNTLFINDPIFYKNISIVKFQRSMTSSQLKLIMMCRELSNKMRNFGVIYETDDLLSPDIPDTNFSSQFYKEAWEDIKKMLSIVHGVTVSTEELKNELLPYNKNIQVLKNHLVPYLWEQQIKSNKRKSGKIRILWAGSQNHFSVKGFGGDFNSELLNFIKKTSNIYTWVFVGSFPNELLEYKDKFEVHNWQKIYEFGSYLKKLNCDIGIAPLEKCKFNDCKSNLKALEFCSLGIPGVYSDRAPYKGLELCSDDNFISNIELLAKNNQEFRNEIWKKDFNKLKDDLYWDDKNIKSYIDKHLNLFSEELP